MNLGFEILPCQAPVYEMLSIYLTHLYQVLNISIFANQSVWSALSAGDRSSPQLPKEEISLREPKLVLGSASPDMNLAGLPGIKCLAENPTIF